MANPTEFTQFLENLGAFESGIDTSKTYGASDLDWLMVFDPNKGNVDRISVDFNNPEDLAMLQYHVHNTLGFLGKYQFGEPLLIDLGYYSPGPNGFYGSTATNEWKGTWTGKNGVNSKEDFMGEVQELAIREAFAMNMGVIETRLSQAGRTLDEFMGQEFTYTRFGVEHTATVTMSGILASAHLQGPGGVANLLLNNTASSDEYGTNILFYMDEFGGFDTPFGTAGNDNLVGSDYSETFSGEAGDNTYETGGGTDKIIITPNDNGKDTVLDFDVNQDVISLSQFGGLTYADLSIHNNPDGHAQIDLPSGQTLVLQNVDAAQVTPDLFVQGPIKLAWSANSGDTVVENFNPTHDLIDLNYAFGNNNLAIYEENGSAVIEVLGNNQRLILSDTPLSDINAFHFIKAPIGFSDAFFSDGADHTPPVRDDSPVDSTPPVVDVPTDSPADYANADYTFTWSWGAHDVIEGFDPQSEVIDLHHFWTDYNSFELYEVNGSTIIDLSNLNNQTIELAGVPLEEVSADNFVGVSGSFATAVHEDSGSDAEAPGPSPEPETQPEPEPTPVDPADLNEYSYTWHWGEDTVVTDFNADTDVINLQGFWTDFNSFSIHNDANGNAVINLTELNNQSITLEGVSTDELSADNIVGVSGSFDAALDLSSSAPDAGTSNTTDSPDSSNSNDVVDDADHEYEFTWNWGQNAEIEQFDTASDVVNLQSFWITPDRVNIYNNAEGDAVIDLSQVNNQTITIHGVSSDELNDNNLMF